MTKRRAHGEGGIYKAKDGRWRASVELGVKDGKRQRKVLTGATKAEVAQKLRQVQTLQDDGLPVSRDGRGFTVEQWLYKWLDAYQSRRVKPRVLLGQRSIVTRHIVPAIGHVRLRELLPEHVARMEADLEKHLSGYTVLNVHRVLSRALAVAEENDHVARNVARRVDAPKVKRTRVEPLTREDARALLAAGQERRHPARWVLALALGLRQSELLGLAWPQVDLDAGTLTVSQQLTRASWWHGCGRPASCGKRRPIDCPQRQGQARTLDDPKSEAGRRTLVLPSPLVETLRTHRKVQLAERLAAGAEWWEAPKAARGYSWDLVFRTADGRPLQQSHDHSEWKALLAQAQVRDARLHDARHTAATLLLSMRVPARVVMEVLGHSKYELTMNTYSHVMPELVRDASEQMTGALWGADDPSPPAPSRRRKTS